MLENKLFKKNLIYLVFGSTLLVHVLILTKLIYFPYPELFVYPYLTNHGLKPYSQILDQHFPGLMFLPINFDNLGMNNEVVARIWSIAILVLTQILLFYISSKILKSKWKALLVSFLYLIWQPFFEGWVLWIDSFLPLILLPSFYFLYKSRLFLCGLLLGIGIVFKQTIIPLTFLTFIFIFWQTRNLKVTFTFLLGLMGPVILMILYLLSIGVIKDFWYWTIVFNLTTYAKYGTSIPPSQGFVTRVLLVYLAAVSGWFIKDRRIVRILFLFLLGSLAGIFDRANFIHFQPSLPFAVLATALGVYQFNKNKFFKVLMLIYIITAVWWLGVFYKGHISNKIFFFDEQTKLISNKIKQYTKKEERSFVFGGQHHLYQMADRLPAGNLFVFQFPWFLKIAGGRILESIQKDKPALIVTDRTVVIEDRPLTEFAEDIDQYIQQNYQVIDRVGSTDIMRRKTP